MASFGGTTFNNLVQGEGRETAAEISVAHIPGGDTSYIDRGGRTLDRLRIAMYFPTLAGYAALRAKVGTSATLTTTEGSWPATLERLSRSQRTPAGEVMATGEFILET